MATLQALPTAMALTACWPCLPADFGAPAAVLTAAGSPSSASTQDACPLQGASNNHGTLPKLTRVLIVGNQRTKRSLIGLECVVKRATGLGGWHWLVRRLLEGRRKGGRGPRFFG
jgi:hypothetical protein